VATDTFYTFVGDGEKEKDSDDASQAAATLEEVHYPARIAVYDDPTVTPRVVVIQPTDIRDYLESITQMTTKLSHEQGGSIPFMIIREIVENYIHASFIAPTISILDGGNTIRFSDQGPGIPDKERALEYGTTTATEDMKRYIRGVGSGLPLAQQYMLDKGGSLRIDDNLSCGTVVTISTRAEEDVSIPIAPLHHEKKPIEVQEEQGQIAERLKDVQVSRRGEMALDYLKTHELVGPSDLVSSYGGSQPTWSRELKTLEEKGLLIKSGQKRHLTEFGKTFVTHAS
jgi:hypothetical protein